jgi:hypothetical protein
LTNTVGAVDQATAPGGQLCRIEADRDIQRGTAAAVTRPGPADVTDAARLSLREDRFLVHVLALMIRAELTDDERQAHVLESVKVVVDRTGVVIHLVHMYRE